ncbi:NTP transferase domain-containing protein [Caldiplasma sukawensis]
MINHIIVQAGGKGSRMGYLTQNKPKCLISISGTTLLETISKAFPGAILNIIVDYKMDALRNYLEAIDQSFNYNIIQAKGKGTCAGIREALKNVPEKESFAISWSDLYYKSNIVIPDSNKNYIGVSNTERCRFTFHNNKFIERSSTENGVIGLFIFNDKSELLKIPDDGEFVKFIASSDIKFDPLLVDSIVEIGTLEKYLQFKSGLPVSRFFNQIFIEDKVVTKLSVNREFQNLVELEAEWYSFMQKYKYENIPKIISYKPLRMEQIFGLHPYEMNMMNANKKRDLITRIIENLENIHKISTSKVNNDDLYNVYVEKTLKRIESACKILKLKPNTDFKVNGKKVRALLPDDVKVVDELFNRLKRIDYFKPIHGDPTFSNIIVTNENCPIFIDPRGYFGNSKIFGDSRYDFAKLYYSAIGNYDQFNNGNFRIGINLPDVTIKVGSSNFEITEDVFSNILKNFYQDIKILHALIWLSLSGYVINDYDSILAAYFMGLYYLDGVLNE